MAEAQTWHQQLAGLQTRLQVLAQEQIQAWGARWDHTLRQQANRWRSAGQEWREMDGWDRVSLLTLVPKDPKQALADQRQAVDDLRRTREWLADNPIEQVQERLRQSAEVAREALQQARMSVEQRVEQRQGLGWEADDPDYLGWQAEQRFYQEQDPDSEWYRADLYHGEPGPDVAIDRAEAEMRRRAREMEFERQELAFDEAQIRRAAGEPMSAADVDNWEHPFEFPTAAEQQAYEDRLSNEREDRAPFGEETGRSLPYDAILVDTSNPQMEEGFQALLARLDQQLDALITETEAETHQIQHQQRRGY